MSSENHYEILGVRPSAGREEIELAYKGRRSQYHPDRYSQSDAETQAWATGKMQEVNKAYQVLISTDLRAKFDRHETPASATYVNQHAPAAQMPDILDAASVLLKPEWEWFHDKVYARPNIPNKKREGAISSYASEIAPRDVIILLDDTLFGGAKEGLLVTNKAIYCKQKFESPRRIALSAIKHVEPGTDGRVLINGDVFFKADLIDHLAILTFASRLSAIFKLPIVSDDDTDSIIERGVSGIDSFWTLHRCAMAALRTELEGQTFLIDDLIDRQMRCISDRLSDLRYAVEQNPKSGTGQNSINAECAEIALMVFLVLHYYGFSKLPGAFKETAGDQFTRLHGISEIYKIAFREGFPLVYGRPIDLDEEDILMMSAIFFHRDGAREFNLTVPREEALLLLLSKIGIRREASRTLLRQFEDHTEWWLEAIFLVSNG